MTNPNGIPTRQWINLTVKNLVESLVEDPQIPTSKLIFLVEDGAKFCGALVTPTQRNSIIRLAWKKYNNEILGADSSEQNSPQGW